MKIVSFKNSLLICLTLVATVVLTGCPSSREGSGTGTGHGPSAVARDSIRGGKSGQTLKSSPDTSGLGTGHRPK